MTKRTNSITALAMSLSFVAACGTEPEPQPEPGTDEVVEIGDDPTEPAAKVVELTESNEDIVNPERGFYDAYELEGSDEADEVRDDGYSLAISVVDLRDFRTGPISASFLGDLDQGFEDARAAGVKIILRFRYNNDYTADAPLPLVLQHIAQLTPVIRANEDVIAVVQGGFVGAHGEWHSSTFGLDDDPAARRAIIGALLDAVPPSRAVQIRKPEYKYEYAAGNVTADEAFTGTDRARLGHHNDCFLASATDLGTYEQPVEQSRAMVAADSPYVPMGGETCMLHERNTCENAIAEMTQLHFSYLNSNYHQGVLERWADDGCYAEISKRLGYRFVAQKLTHSERVAPGGVLALRLDIANRGFAVPMNERPIEVVLTADGVRHVARLSVDARQIKAGETTAIAARLRVPADLAPGSYRLAVRMPDAADRLADDTRYAIQLANAGVWDEATGDNLLTDAFVVDAGAPGQRDAGATAFVELD